MVTQDSLQRHQPASRPDQDKAPARMTGRGSVLAMFAVFFIGNIIADLAHANFFAGLGLVIGCALAAKFARRSALLTVAVTPPLIFLAAVVCSESVTSSSTTGHSGFVAVAEGTVLTLAAVAPWLFAGVAISVTIAFFRGLPQCVRELRDGLRGR